MLGSKGLPGVLVPQRFAPELYLLMVLVSSDWREVRHLHREDL